ncbi:MAG: transcription-repair coupling factor [Parvularculales bacterium]
MTMPLLKDWATSSPGMLWGAPEGVDAMALAHLVEENGGRAVHVALDDAGLSRMAASVSLLSVDPEAVLEFPAWDCLPYDRISPGGVLTGKRLHCLAELAARPDKPRIILTTVNAWLQKTPPRAMFRGASLNLKPGDTISAADLMRFFTANAYHRADTVRETGEFAIRGGIVDVFPPGAGEPVRVDFFDTEIETIRHFDPETQRSTAGADVLALHPVSEFILDEETISAFRGRYLECFGAEASRDPLYLSISEGRHHPGMEHMLPLYHDSLEHLSDYTGPATPVLMADEMEAATRHRFDQINDFHTARIEAMQLATDQEGDSIWRPLPPDALYLDDTGHTGLRDKLLTHQVSSFGRQDGTPASGHDAGGRRGAIYHAAATEARLEGEGASSPSRSVGKEIPQLIKSAAVLLAASSEGARSRIDELIGEHLPQQLTINPVTRIEGLAAGQVYSATWPIEDGFTLPGLTVITEKDIYGNRITRPSRRRRRGENFLREVSSLQKGDLVVHVDHGIGRYEGLERIETTDAQHDCLLIIYAGGDKLFLPVENIDLLSRYGKEGGDAQMDRLGSASWQARKARIKGRIREIAEQLIKVAAMRQTAKTEPIMPDPGGYTEFCQRFVFAETDDQTEAIDDVMRDLASGQVMDRLICGDVGFGKTEVAMRAAYAVAMAGFQIAVVTPTTLLARQHRITFEERFRGLPVKIGMLSRMTGAAAASRLREEIASGECQIAIGTHALLSKKVEYDNLGLAIVDEEQNFGVSQKERLKALRGDVHVLTLSATPIPRTLQMALSGVREMSIIATPPVDRLAVRTFVGPWDTVVLAEAVRRERFRGGQVFCVCPRIDHLPRVYDRLQAMVPEARIITAHGRMPSDDLDQAMTRFADGNADVLLSTNIIESGIDISSANTMIIHRADMFGLSQLYQLRGRVGRSRQRAYAYLTTDASRILTEQSKRRLEVMQTLDSLGAGFTLASYDLDIRGAGNLLGDEQSGHVREVGVELYQEMLREAVNVARLGADAAAETETSFSPVINLGTTVLIPDGYVNDLTVRLSLYRRIAATDTMEEVESLLAEMVDRFGPYPEEVRNLIDTIQIKILCRQTNVAKIDAGPKGLSLEFRDNRFDNPEALIGYIAGKSGQVQLTGDHRLTFRQTLPISNRARAVQQTLEEIRDLVIPPEPAGD